MRIGSDISVELNAAQQVTAIKFGDSDRLMGVGGKLDPLIDSIARTVGVDTKLSFSAEARKAGDLALVIRAADGNALNTNDVGMFLDEAFARHVTTVHTGSVRAGSLANTSFDKALKAAITTATTQQQTTGSGSVQRGVQQQLSTRIAG